MGVYVWRGVNRTGKSVKGVLDADSPKMLKANLRRDGIMVTEVLEESVARVKKAREVDLGRIFNFVTTADIAMITRQLSTLLHAGIPLVEGLSALIDQVEKPALQSALTQTRDRVNEGTSLADAMKEHPKLFSTLYVNMVAAGEASGTLESVLTRLADFMEAQSKLKSKIVSAMAYPAFMILLSIGVIAVMMLVVVPKVTAVFDDFGQALPWYTRALIFISDILLGFWFLIIPLVAAAIFGFIAWKRSPDGKATWDRWILRVPIFGSLATLIAVTRFARTLATLLGSGVPVLQAMEITRNVIGNTVLMEVVEEARNAVREGESIAMPLKKSGRFPPIVTHMIAIGERSGQLEAMLEHVARAYDTQVENRITALTSLLEPLIIVGMGGIAGFIAFSILMPLMQINEFVGG